VYELFYFGQNRKRNMKKTFQKTLIAASVGVVMLSAAGTASANSLLFPYFTTVGTAQSVLSLSLTTTAGNAKEDIHYVYNYGADCIHYDATGTLTNNDTLTHAIAAGSFNKVPTADASTGVYFPLADTGFLVVSTKSSATAGLRGSMAIIDLTNNLVVSYPGIDNGGDTSGVREGDFSGITDKNFGLAFLPSAVATTSWFGVVVGNMNSVISTGANWAAKMSYLNSGAVFDNDEVSYSGTNTAKVLTCQGVVKPADLMTTAQATSVGVNGGFIRASGTGAGGGTGVVFVKQQLLGAGAGSYSGKTVQHREAAASF
jgi:hypothetical protein